MLQPIQCLKYGVLIPGKALTHPLKVHIPVIIFVNTLILLVDAQFFVPDVGWRYFRYAEILLNYAEACIGLGAGCRGTYLYKYDKEKSRYA